MHTIKVEEIADGHWVWHLFKDGEIILASRSMYKDSETAEYFGGLEIKSIEIGKPVYGSIASWHCLECKKDTFLLDEYYMVHNDLWMSALREKDMDVNHGTDGMLCIKCLESRIGRELKAVDFTSAPISHVPERHRSELLQKRLKAV